MTAPADPLLLQALETLLLAERQLGDAADRLSAAAPTAVRLADDTDWSTQAAVRFHTAAETWQADMSTLAALAAAAREDVRRLSERMQLLAWGHLFV
ncbi:MAG: hypothetical protein ABWY37_04705 [Microbacterium pygmaeum]